uniref:Uncharacterized protein n=1 Tax=Panagrolaimus sp. JU765 TaxID=591449 RepID=A0AC34Q5C7_9BILA
MITKFPEMPFFLWLFHRKNMDIVQDQQKILFNNGTTYGTRTGIYLHLFQHACVFIIIKQDKYPFFSVLMPLRVFEAFIFLLFLGTSCSHSLLLVLVTMFLTSLCRLSFYQFKKILYMIKLFLFFCKGF